MRLISSSCSGGAVEGRCGGRHCLGVTDLTQAWDPPGDLQAATFDNRYDIVLSLS